MPITATNTAALSAVTALNQSTEALSQSIDTIASGTTPDSIGPAYAVDISTQE